MTGQARRIATVDQTVAYEISAVDVDERIHKDVYFCTASVATMVSATRLALSRSSTNAGRIVGDHPHFHRSLELALPSYPSNRLQIGPRRHIAGQLESQPVHGGIRIRVRQQHIEQILLIGTEAVANVVEVERARQARRAAQRHRLWARPLPCCATSRAGRAGALRRVFAQRRTPPYPGLARKRRLPKRQLGRRTPQVFCAVSLGTP